MGFQLYHAISMFLGVALEFDRFLGLSPASSFGFAHVRTTSEEVWAHPGRKGAGWIDEDVKDIAVHLGLWVGFSSSNVSEVPFGEPLVEVPSQWVFATYCWWIFTRSTPSLAPLFAGAGAIFPGELTRVKCTCLTPVLVFGFNLSISLCLAFTTSPWSFPYCGVQSPYIRHSISSWTSENHHVLLVGAGVSGWENLNYHITLTGCIPYNII